MLRLLPALLVAAPAAAQWNPSAGQWGESDPLHLRVMTWNVEDGLCSTADKGGGATSWEALARIAAALQPDVLLLQECGDNDGNGTGSGVDSVSELTTTLELWMHGGNDPFEGGAVGAYVQLYAPGYDLPHVFVSSQSDGFNRNAILSRYPFADLNGDGKATMSDIPTALSGGGSWADGGDGGIRGCQVAEIDLPNGSYSGDLVVLNLHLKAGGSASDEAQRIAAAKNISYVVQFWFNANGGPTPDPFGKILDSPQAQFPLAQGTPVVVGGDYNQVETGGANGPVGWMAEGQVTGGLVDGTDRDLSDAARDFATNPFTGSQGTLGGSKLDYVVFQDSQATSVRQFTFRTSSSPSSFPPGAMPSEVAGFPVPTSASTFASDHLPVVVDLEVVSDCDGDGTPNAQEPDWDADGVPDDCDNCPYDANPDQADTAGGQLGDACENVCQEDLGFAGPGTAQLSACGPTLFAGQSGLLTLFSAPVSSPAFLVYSQQQAPLPIVGGTLVPNLATAGFASTVTSVFGHANVPFPGGCGPFDLYVQFAVYDPTQAENWQLSNALRLAFLP